MTSQIFRFYYEGFKNLTVGKTLWKLILIKLVVILFILNHFVYDKSIKTEYKSETAKQNFVFENLTKGDFNGR